MRAQPRVRNASMDIGPPLVADGQPPVLAEPGQGALHHPAMATQPLAGVDAFAGDAHPDVALGKRAATARDVVGLVGMQLGRPLAAVAVRLLDRRHGIEHRPRRRPIRGGWPRSAVSPMGVRARSVRMWRFVPGLPRSVGLGPTTSPPFWPGCWHSRALARLQSIWPASPRRSSRSAVEGVPDARPPASRAADASRSCPTHSPSPGAASPTGCRISARR